MQARKHLKPLSAASMQGIRARKHAKHVNTRARQTHEHISTQAYKHAKHAI